MVAEIFLKTFDRNLRVCYRLFVSVGSVLSGIKRLVGANNLGAVEFVVIKV